MATVGDASATPGRNARPRSRTSSAPRSLRLAQDNGALLKGRFAPAEATAVLLATCMGNAVAPYEIDYEEAFKPWAWNDEDHVERDDGQLQGSGSDPNGEGEIWLAHKPKAKPT